MSILRKTKKNQLSQQKPTKGPKRGWRIASLIFGLFIIFVISFFAYVYSAGSKMFENGISGKNLLKTIYGKEQLKGEAEDRINILITGMGGANHPGGMLADSIIVLSIRPKEKQAAMISIPRDLLVTIPDHGQDKINSSFADGYNDYMNKSCKKKNKDQCRSDGIAAGENLTSQVVSSVLGIPIHYYVNADFNGFAKIIDQLGGIDVYVDKAIYDPLFPDKNMKGYDPFKISAGQHHMDGATALKYARSRETTSDFDRAGRQQKVIQAVKEKALSSGFLANPQKIIDIISTLGDSIKTNFSISEIKTFAGMVKDIPSGSVITKVLSTASDSYLTDYNNGTYYEVPKSGNFRDIQKFAQNIFNTEVKENSRIEIQNASSISNAASSLSTVLKNSNYNVVSITNSKTKVKKTVIYDYTNGKYKDTLNKLKTGLSASVVQKTSSSTTGNVDITIIIGEDYTGFSKSLN